MNTAKNLISNVSVPSEESRTAAAFAPVVSADMPVMDLLPRLLDSPNHTLAVSDGERNLGVLTESLLLEGLAREISRRDDCAIITLSCAPGDYSASRIATAVEDAGVHLIDLWSGTPVEGRTTVSLRVRCDDPTGVVHSLERYGFEVTDVYAQQYAEAEAAEERMMALQAFLNV